MRVIAGSAGGIRLAVPKRGARPTMDRVKAAIFSSLGEAIIGARVLDLYAGSGALGIEALSRGAVSATFVDRDPRAVAAIRRNLDAVGVEQEVRRLDALRYLAGAEDASFDLVFVDPPYDSAGRLGNSLSERLPRILTEHARIVTESHKRTPLQLDLPLVRERAY